MDREHCRAGSGRKDAVDTADSGSEEGSEVKVSREEEEERDKGDAASTKKRVTGGRWKRRTQTCTLSRNTSACSIPPIHRSHASD